MGRVALFDNLKGFAILLVVIGHFATKVLDGCDSHFTCVLMTAIWVFHIPLFFFVSGLFAGKSWRRCHRAPVDKALLYFLLFLVFIFAVVVYEVVFWQDIRSMAVLNVKRAPWFMLALTWYMLLVPLLAKGQSKPVLGLALCVAAGAAAGWFYSAVDLLAGLRTLTYLPYFALGFYLSPEGVLRFRAQLTSHVGGSYRLAMGLVAFAALVGGLALLPNEVLFMVKELSAGSSTYYGLHRMIGIPQIAGLVLRVLEYFVVVALIAACILVLPSRPSALTLFGQRSFQIYMVHIFVIYTIDRLNFYEAVAATSPLWALSPLVFGAALTWLLSLPAFPNKLISKLGKWCAKIVKL